MTAYNFMTFHQFEVSTVHHEISLYHYSYPPVTALVCIPFGLLPYPLAWFVWQTGGWLAFALALRRIGAPQWCLLALAWPAVFVNAIGGQNGCWIAAIIGWALLELSERHSIRAGLLFSLMVIKPQLGWIIPLALLSSREWKALGAMAAGSAGLLLTSLLVSGLKPWLAWHDRLAILRQVILEDGTGVMHRMISIFVLVRHAGMSVITAYEAQTIATVIGATLLVLIWHKSVAFQWKATALIYAILTTTPYVSDYDCVMLAFPCAWLWSTANSHDRLALSISALVPITAAAIARGTGVPLTALLLWGVYLWFARKILFSGPNTTLVQRAA
ncbi:glycosyltransferase family 87 protein [Acetobacter sp.]|uniref:glycosyltransferase family 87 protein n=1 Tax=Acetobacter sp. TaxID=440 RepID=UPI0039EC834C